MCLSSPKQPSAPIHDVPVRAEEVVEKPIELVTADKTDAKKKKKLASKSGTSQLNTALNYTTGGSSSGLNT